VNGEGPIDIVFIGGCDRSGSTLLSLLLGEVPGVCNLGELRGIWQRGLAANHLCGCGVPFRSCGFWTEVLGEAQARAASVPIEESLRLRWAVDRMRYLPWLLSPPADGRFALRLRRYREALATVLRAVMRVTGATVLVDSTKGPSAPLVLAGVPGARVRVIHLVRDSRAVVRSFGRRSLNPAVHQRTVYMRRRGVVGASVYWTVINLLTHLTTRRSGAATFLRYEDLAARPDATMDALLPTLGLPALPPALLEGGRLSFSRQHTVSGNPMRFKGGVTEIRPDDEWKTALPRWAKVATTAITWPLLWRYGYFGEASPRDDARLAASRSRTGR
jgi:hypothetical protein